MSLKKPWMGFYSNLCDFLLLALLSKRDMYGYEIIKELEVIHGGIFAKDEQQIYDKLKKLKATEFVSRYRVNAGEERYRMYLHLEPAGFEYLNRNKEELMELTMVAGTIASLIEGHQENDL